MGAVELAYDVTIEPHPFLMVRETNTTYTVEVALERNQQFHVFDQGRFVEITD